ncbi:MAG: hypothetical protein OXG65_02415 [Chloroflexi bacterium]|nr:hypothetical protein [Chloroflexota bacterium]
MSIGSRLSSLFRRRKSRDPNHEFGRERREFIYLDEVSVLSILASRTGRIATESTESQTSSQNSEIKGSVGVGLSGTKANLGTMMQASQVEASQVSRKATIQSSFKDLYNIERSSLALHTTNPGEPPTVDLTRGLEGLLASTDMTGFLVDPCKLYRGELLEVEVELEADPIFRMSSIITTLVGLMEDNEELFKNAVAVQLSEIRSVARLLDSLLVGLVPIRGRLVDFKWMRISNRAVLVHQSLLNQMPIDAQHEANPVFLVGVTQNDLFWKDIRRLLFSRGRYTVFCRLATDGLADKWSPVKMADVFSGMALDFDEMIQSLGDELMSGFKRGVRTATAGTTVNGTRTMLNAQRGKLLLRHYVMLLAGYHKLEIEASLIEDLICGLSYAENWMDSVDGYRPVLAEVTKIVDNSLKVETPRDVAHDLRLLIMGHPELKEAVEPGGSTVGGDHPESRCERYLDSEIIAIYW